MNNHGVFLLFVVEFHNQISLLVCKRTAIPGRCKNVFCCGVLSPAMARSSYLQRCVVNQTRRGCYLRIFSLLSSITALEKCLLDHCVQQTVAYLSLMNLSNLFLNSLIFWPVQHSLAMSLIICCVKKVDLF